MHSEIEEPTFQNINFDEIQSVVTLVCEELELRGAQLPPRDLGRYVRLVYETVKRTQPSEEKQGALVKTIIDLNGVQLNANNDVGP